MSDLGIIQNVVVVIGVINVEAKADVKLNTMDSEPPEAISSRLQANKGGVALICKVHIVI